jgi:glycosyltransferase involved in cell wall biosynthesis
VSGHAAAVWCDLSNLARHSGPAGGIQRAIAGLATGLRAADAAPPARFCLFDKHGGFRPLEPGDVDALLDDLAHARTRERGEPTLFGALRRRLETRAPLRAPFARGDVLLNPGFMTYKPGQHAATAALLAGAGARYVGVLYDLLPVVFPEWWTPEQQRRYREWFAWTGRHAALVLCCSEATRRDALRFFADEKIEAGPVETVALGDELPSGLAAARRAAAAAPASAPFVLYVSTREVRKNHRLLFQVWRRLLAAHGPERVPELVLVGKRGWLVDDFLTELEQARFLDGKIVWRDRVDDAELARLYASCLFTVYPSFAEGWGLPVAEGLAFGKYCVASSSSSLPEVGRDFADYHDPWDVAGATALIERAVFDPELRAKKERLIRERFRARSWREAAADLLARIAAQPEGKSTAR